MRQHIQCALLVLVGGFALASALLPDLKSLATPAAVLSALLLARLLGPLFEGRLPGLPRAILGGLALISWPFAVLFLMFGRFDVAAFIAHFVDGITGFTPWDAALPVTQAGVGVGSYALAATALASRFGSANLLRVAYVPLLAINPVVMENLKGLVAPRLTFPIEAMLTDAVPLPAALAPPDILVLYLEGTERGFADLPDYAAAYAPLRELEAQGLSFTNVAQLEGTGWSSAGIMATTCGLNHPISWSEFFHIRLKDERFFSHFACLTDFLAARDYDMATLIGSDANFAGHSDFFSRHGVQKNFGRDEVRAQFGTDYYDRHSFGWAVDDQAITETAARLFAGLGQDGRPRFLLAATLGPHGDDSFLPAGCAGNAKAEERAELAATLRCGVQHAMRLVEAVKAAERPNGLRIIIMSDHLNRARSLRDRLPVDDRRNTVIFIGGTERGVANDRPGTMVDVYPTLLDWLGLARPPVAAGLGRSLLEDEPNLLDHADLATLAVALRYRPGLWNAMMARTVEAPVLP